MSQTNSTSIMPLLFIGHGSPMNAIEINDFTQKWHQVVKDIPRPRAILSISAHWLTKGVKVTAMENPKTIHDFGGFPSELYQIEYPAPGSAEVAKSVKLLIKSHEVELDYNWGFDHGCWSILKHLYPDADIPVAQLSLNVNLSPQEHYNLAKELEPLRSMGVLIFTSGNMVHNLALLDWRNTNGGYDWAEEANTLFVKLITERNHQALINYSTQGKSVQLAIPSPDHYWPLLYTLALQQPNETVEFFNNQIVMGSLSMTSMVVR